MESEQSDIDVFKDALADDDPEVQMAAIVSLPAMAMALDTEKTRDLLLPYLLQIVTEISDEMQVNTAEQLKRFIPLVGGYEHVDAVLQILVKMCVTDETLVRERAVEAINVITENLDSVNCENLLIPLIQDLSAGEWFTNKCSATALFPPVYTKVCDESKTELRHIYINLTQDEAPLVKKAAASNLVGFLSVVEPSFIKEEFVPVLDNIAKDLQDSVKPLAVDIGITIAERLNDESVKDGIFEIVEQFSSDESWKIRYKVASAIDKIQNVLGADKNRGKILKMFQELSKDNESEVRIAAMKNLFSYCSELKKSYEKSPCPDNFEPVIIQSIVPLIKFVFDDPVEEVLIAASSHILSLCTLVPYQSFDENILPIVVEALEKHHSIRLKEVIMKQFDVLPPNIQLSKYLESIKQALRNLVLDSKLHWRTRRSIVVAFVHICKYISKDYFDSNLKNFYFHLLDDPIFAVRRTASIILPLLADNFGMKWLMVHLLPSFMIWSRHRKYLYRFVALNGINEMIAPSVENHEGRTVFSYLSFFKNSDLEQSLKALEGIVYLNGKILEQLSSEKFTDILNKYNATDFVVENVKIYAEDTLNALERDGQSVFDLSESCFKEDDFCYLEGLLILCLKSFLPVIARLSKDNITNVQVFSRHTLKVIKEFVDGIQEEIGHTMIQDKLKTLNEEEKAKVHENLEVFMKHMPIGPHQKITYDDVKPEHLVTASDESLPDLGAEVLDLEISDAHQTVNSEGESVLTDLDELSNVEETKTEAMEVNENPPEVLKEVPGSEKDFVDIFDPSLSATTV